MNHPSPGSPQHTKTEQPPEELSSVPAIVKAILKGKKTQTRRLMESQPKNGLGYMMGSEKAYAIQCGPDYPDDETDCVHCPYGKPGNRFYVKEATYLWCERRPNGRTKTGRPKWHYVPLESAPVFYVADGHKPGTSVVSPETGNRWGWRYKTARFMPKYAARIKGEITDVRVQRLQEISEADAIAEGFEADDTFTARGNFWMAWDAIHASNDRHANPWVWAITFRRVHEADDLTAVRP